METGCPQKGRAAAEWIMVYLQVYHKISSLNTICPELSSNAPNPILKTPDSPPKKPRYSENHTGRIAAQFSRQRWPHVMHL